MKYKNLKFITLIAVTTLLTVGCNKLSDFGNTNDNPNGTEVPSTAALLTGVESQLGGIATQTLPGLYVQYFSETQYTENSLYALPKLNFDGIIAGPLMDLQNIINFNTDPAKIPLAAKFGSANNQIAIARILKAYIFWTITDRWGDIPYSQALKGDSILTPKYDTQESIYKDLLKELAEAKNQFDGGAPAEGDMIYYNKSQSSTWDAAKSKWKKAANTLRMLISLRMSKVYPNAGQFAANEFTKAFTDADGYISANSDNLQVNYPGTSAHRNPWYNLYNGRSDFAVSKFFIDLVSGGDPRRAQFGSSSVGFPYGLKRDDAVAFGEANTSYAKIMQGSSTDQKKPVVVLAASYTLLAIAEAANRGWIVADGAAMYKNGVNASWGQWGVTGDIDVYLSTRSYSLANIHLQQYIAFYPDGIQGWSNWRRTNVPPLTPTPNATNSSKQIPRRYVYGTRAYALNEANTTEAASRIGGDTEDKRVWWDK